MSYMKRRSRGRIQPESLGTTPLASRRDYTSGVYETTTSDGGAVMAPEQRDVQGGRCTTFNVSFNSFQNLFQGTQVQIIGQKLQKQTGGKMLQDMFIHIRLTCTVAATQLIPAPLWFDSIEFKTSTDRRIQILYGLENWFLMNFHTNEELAGIANNNMFSLKDYMGVREQDIMQINDVRDVWIPTNAAWLESFQKGLNAQAMQEDIEIRLIGRPDIRYAGAGTLTVNLLDMVFKSFDYSREMQMENELNRLWLTKPISADYLDCVDCTQSPFTITAGARVPLQLTMLDKKTVAFMMLGVRANDLPANGGCYNFLDLGPQTTVDIQDPTGNSILGSNGANFADYLRNSLVPQNVAGAMSVFAPGMIYIPLADALPGTLRGIKTGQYYFDNNNYNLVLNMSAAGAAEVQTITQAVGVATGGSYRLGFKGAYTQNLAFNTAVADMKAAFEALDTVRNYPGGRITVTFSAALSAAAAPTATFGEQRRLPLIDVDVQGLATGAAVNSVGCVVTRTTNGNRGWTTGTTYQLVLYAMFYKNVTAYSGRLITREY